MFLIINVVLPVGIVVMVFSSPIASNGGDVDDADGLSSARAIGVVIASGPAGLSRVSSGTVDGVPRLGLSLPALCLGFNEDV